ncbi:Adult-specific rigid cuticular protein 15.7 like protein [Argiope bruennichi]|uniref:Adult-specific rigid cuticular protein 15.7 like protein n=1 Tax=Argiope bruennichi TaxID=94029 RepID=A0A8T0FED0_ARGBR|nr:Adult-specific rigid cuticular protein 15.7 like protein [Argiope bruennichi]
MLNCDVRGGNCFKVVIVCDAFAVAMDLNRWHISSALESATELDSRCCYRLRCFCSSPWISHRCTYRQHWSQQQSSDSRCFGNSLSTTESKMVLVLPILELKFGDAPGNKKGTYTIADIDGRARESTTSPTGPLGSQPPSRPTNPERCQRSSCALIASPYAGPVPPRRNHVAPSCPCSRCRPSKTLLPSLMGGIIGHGVLLVLDTEPAFMERNR